MGPHRRQSALPFRLCRPGKRILRKMDGEEMLNEDFRELTPDNAFLIHQIVDDFDAVAQLKLRLF